MADIKGLNNINPAQLGNITQPAQPGALDKSGGALFKDILNEATANFQTGIANKANAASDLKFSQHAVDRMRSRGVMYSPEQLQKIEGAVTKAAAKGSKETLVLTDNSALVVSVKNKTVITVMDKNALKDNVFTNIDSTVVI